ncbi:CsbD family protein [Nitrosomonas communis]|uniref:Uncharacterized conserved protein YjbJ, UPF0337 family n=1 Tax=Nitrosomonas communis TaxID=44574 RepID=A0A1I4XBV6_9PROT|nr:CsbD family protein [Nitrosomonas communis]SFN23411.1 Uncharacterized conserved protein YjbJ, UPF0337 family [Nitrosomonas communis]
MSWDKIEGKWRYLIGKVKEQWGKFNDNDCERIAGKREKLIGDIQKKYGISKEEAEKQVGDWKRNPNV